MMRSWKALTILAMLPVAACGSTSAQGTNTTPAEPATLAEPQAEVTTLEAALAVGVVLGPIVDAAPPDRINVGCERAAELLSRADVLRDTPPLEEMPRPQACREDIVRLRAASSSIVTFCEERRDAMDSHFAIPVELSWFRVMDHLQPFDRAAETGEGGSEAIRAAWAVREALEPIVQAPVEEREAALCQGIEPLSQSYTTFNEVGTPEDVMHPERYREELARLGAVLAMTSEYCSREDQNVPGESLRSIEVTFLRCWSLLHGRWPGRTPQAAQ
jgi:hypothetical protein